MMKILTPEQADEEHKCEGAERMRDYGVEAIRPRWANRSPAAVAMGNKGP